MEDAHRLQEEEINTLKSIFFAEFEDHREKKRSRGRFKRSDGKNQTASLSSPCRNAGIAEDSSLREFSIRVCVEEMSSGLPENEKFPAMNIDLKFRLEHDYPVSGKPIIDICNPENVDETLLTHIKYELEKMSSERIGEQIIYDLVEKTRDLLRNDQEDRKTALARQKAAVALDKAAREREEQDFKEEVRKRETQSKAPHKLRPISLPVESTVPSARPPMLPLKQLPPTMQSIRMRASSMSVDESKPQHYQVNETDQMAFLVYDNSESLSVNVKTQTIVKECLLGDQFSLYLANSSQNIEGENTFFVLKGTFSVDTLTPLAQVTKYIDEIEREADVLRQCFEKKSFDKQLVRLVAFSPSQTVSPVECSFQILLSFPGCGIFLSDYAFDRSSALSSGMICSFTQQIAMGLQFLHMHNVLHRFLVPELIYINFLNGSQVHVSLMLYNVGKTIIDHMPSSVRNRKIDQRLRFIRKHKDSKKTDVLLLGCCVYYLVTNGIYPTSVPIKPLSAADSSNESLVNFVNSIVVTKENERPTISGVLQSPFMLSANFEFSNRLSSGIDECDEDFDSEWESDTEGSSGSENAESDIPIEATAYHSDSRLLKDFRIINVLGKGGFGECFKAQNKLDGRLYAVKRVQLPGNDPLLNRMIVREVKLLSRLSHDNIVRYYNAWQEMIRIKKRRRRNDSSAHPESSSGATTGANQVEDELKKPERSPSFGVKFSAPPPVSDNSDDEWSDASGNSAEDDSISDEEMSLFNFGLSGCQYSDSKAGMRARQMIDFNYSSSSDFVQFERGSEVREKSGHRLDTVEGEDSSEQPDSSQLLLCLYIQMELCDSTLRRLISSDALFEPPSDENTLSNGQRRAFGLFKQLVEGLSYIHKQGMIHRDLTPNNIFLTNDDRVKIGDFGFAARPSHPGANRQNSLIAVSPEMLEKAKADAGISGVDPNTPSVGACAEDFVVGTSFYISPDILLSEGKGTYDAKTDMYCLGVVMLEMFYRFGTASERVSVLSSIQCAAEDTTIAELVESLWSKELVEKTPLKRVVKLVKKLTQRNPNERPSAAQILSGDYLPSPGELGDKQLSKLIESIVPSTKSPEYKHLLTTLFASSSESMKPMDDYLFDCFIYPKQHDELAVWKRTLVDKMVREFFHRFSCRSYYWPMLMPYSKATQKRPYDEAVELETMLSSSGVPLSLPFDLRVCFARHVVRANISECRRFEISRVFRAARVERGYPTERTELAVDIITPVSLVDESTLSASSISVILVDVVCICADLCKQFVWGSQALKQASKSAHKTFRKATSCLVLNHLDLLRSVLFSLPSVQHSSMEVVDTFIADVNKKLLMAQPTELNQYILNEMLLDYFPESKSSFQDIVRLLSQLLFSDTEWTDCEELNRFVRSYRKILNSQLSQQLARRAISQLRCVMGVTKSLYPNLRVVIHTNYIHQPNVYSRFVFKIEQFAGPNTSMKSNQTSKSDTSEVRRSTLAVGGDYSRLLDIFKFHLGNTVFVKRVAAGFSFDFESLQRMTTIPAGYPLLLLPYVGEVTVALAYPSTAAATPGETSSINENSIVDLLRFCSELRTNGFSVSPVLYRQATVMLESDSYLTAHLPVSRVIILMKHEKPESKSDNVVNVSFELYFRIAGTNRMDSSTIDASTGSFSSVIMAVQERCSSAASRMLQQSSGGVFDTIMSNVLLTGASIALGQQTPTVETCPPLEELSSQSITQTPYLSSVAPSAPQQPVLVSNALAGGMSAYTDFLWLCEERLPMKDKRRIEIQMISTLSPKLKTFNPSAHVDVVLLEIDSACLGTLASWLAIQSQKLVSRITVQTCHSRQSLANLINVWAENAFQIGGDIDTAITERHPRHRNFLKQKIPEIVELLATRTNSHYQQMLFSSASSHSIKMSSSSPLNVSRQSSPPPIMVLYAIKDNGYQFLI